MAYQSNSLNFIHKFDGARWVQKEIGTSKNIKDGFFKKISNRFPSKASDQPAADLLQINRRYIV